MAGDQSPADPTILFNTFIFGAGGIPDGDDDDLEFTFDDFYLPSDTEDFLNSIAAPLDPPCWDQLQFSTDAIPDAPKVSYSGSGDHISISAGARVLNSTSPESCQEPGDRSLDVATLLNVSSPEASHESDAKALDVVRFLNYPSPETETHDREVSGSASSQGSGNSGSSVSEALNYYSSPENSINCVFDETIKSEEEGDCSLLKRKNESEDANSELRASKYMRSNAGENFSATGEEEEDKRKVRLIRNRESAQLSRQRKKHYVEELENKVRSMHSTIQDLNTRISYVITENVNLRQQLSGGAMCQPPVPPPATAKYHRPPMTPMHYPWMPHCPPYVVKPHGSEVPRVPIPRLKPHQPSAAPKAKKVESKKNEGKTKRVASVSFLGFLVFIVLFGGFVPMVNVKFGGTQYTVPSGSYNFGNAFYEHHGRVLTVKGHLNGSDQNIGMGLSKGTFGSVTNFTNKIDGRRGCVTGGESNIEQKEGSQPFPGSDEFVRPSNSCQPLLASLYVPRNDGLVKIDGNLIIHSVLASEKSMASHKDSGMKSSTETGLAVAGHMSSAIPLTGRNSGRHPQMYKNPSERKRALGSSSADNENLKSTAAEGLQQWFQQGLAGPMLSSGMCTEVFQFDVSPAPGAIVPATSILNVSAERHPNATHRIKGRNRRILPEAPHNPLAPSQNNISKEENGKRNVEKDNFERNDSVSSIVVSVLVDPREAGDIINDDGVMGPKSLSQIFVVVLIDSVRYVTYSCMLPLKGLGAPLATT